MQVMNAKVRDVERQLRYRLMDQGLPPEQRTQYLKDYKVRMQEYSKASEVPKALKVRQYPRDEAGRRVAVRPTSSP